MAQHAVAPQYWSIQRGTTVAFANPAGNATTHGAGFVGIRSAFGKYQLALP
ncbi:hypothetical protein ACFY1U_34955 [Streptomyces sp. NPDC001351]|uniref:hypothetical protein n=1 Tax=Streptomyces sp. NPDC001351 TaxID=3364564 RepID=UPI0036C509B9